LRATQEPRFHEGRIELLSLCLSISQRASNFGVSSILGLDALNPILARLEIFNLLSGHHELVVLAFTRIGTSIWMIHAYATSKIRERQFAKFKQWEFFDCFVRYP